MEEWKICRLFPKYMISNFGNVKHIKRNKIKKIGEDKNGYKVVSLSYDGSHLLARLLADSFIGCVDGYDVHHIDHNRSNNSLDNLEIISNSEHMSYHTSNTFGENNRNAKLKDSEVVEIYDLLLNTNKNQVEIGKLYGVTESCVSLINRGKSFQHLNLKPFKRYGNSKVGFSIKFD